MRRLYTYVSKENTVKKDGLLSPLKCSGALEKYYKRAGTNKEEDVLFWLEKSFCGRSRSISCLTEPVHWKGNDSMLREFVESRTLFSYDLDDLLKDGLIEKIFCKTGSAANGFDEKFYEVSESDMDFSSLAWDKCCKEKGLFFAVIRHYMLVLKDGFIPPKYLKEEQILF